MNNSYNSTSII